MLVNPLLFDMTTQDLAQRYRNTFAKYDNAISFISNISTKEIYITTRKGSSVLQFDPRKLDVFRPAPRWVVNENDLFYIHYKFNKQFARGFCADNTTILTFNPQGVFGRKLRFPEMKVFNALTTLYDAEINTIRCSVRDVFKELDKQGWMLLSPQVVIIQDEGANNQIFFREKCIGLFGSCNPLFCQEVKELVGDYTNEDDAWHIRNPKAAVKKGKVPLNHVAHLRRGLVNQARGRNQIGIREDDEQLQLLVQDLAIDPAVPNQIWIGV